MTDWESLSKQLKDLGVKMGKDHHLTPPQQKKHPIESVVTGRFWQVIYGEVFCHEETYAPHHQHGMKSLYPTEPIEMLCRWANAEPHALEDLDTFFFTFPDFNMHLYGVP